MWKADASPDKDLLPLLNQYCFRCHSSVNYHVFDRKAVVGRKSSIVGRVGATGTLRMPQDRTLDDATKNKIIQLANQLK